MDDQVRDEKQEDGGEDKAGDDGRGTVVGDFETFFPGVKCGLELSVHPGDQREQFPVEFLVVASQAVRVGAYVPLPFLLYGEEFPVQRVEGIRIGR